MLGDIKLKGDLVELAEELDPAGLLPGSFRFQDNIVRRQDSKQGYYKHLRSQKLESNKLR